MLVVVLAAATPVGLLVYSAVGTGVFAPRNLTASIPAACLLAGWLLSRLPARIALASGGLLAAGLLLGAVVSLGASKQRPDLAAAAAFIDAHAGAREPYAEVPLFFVSAPELAQGLRLNFDRPHPSEPVAFRAAAGRVRPSVPRRAWLAAAGGRRLFIVSPELPNLTGLPQPPPGLASRVRRQDLGGSPGSSWCGSSSGVRRASAAITTSVCVPARVSTVTSTPRFVVRVSGVTVLPSSVAFATVAPAGSVCPIVSLETGEPTCTRVL